MTAREELLRRVALAASRGDGNLAVRLRREALELEKDARRTRVRRETQETAR